MKITIDKEEFDVPFDANIIPLKKYIEYYALYGKQLDEDLNSILSDKKLSEEDLFSKLDSHVNNEALAWFSFWTNINLFEAANTPNIIPVLMSYRTLRSLFTQPQSDSYPVNFKWMNEEWEIKDFKLNPASDMTFNEIITSKEITNQVKALGDGKWSGLPYLCAIFLRKKGEAFNDSFVNEGSERLMLMNELPLSMALSVSFFLSASVYFWRKTSAYLEEEALP